MVSGSSVQLRAVGGSSNPLRHAEISVFRPGHGKSGSHAASSGTAGKEGLNAMVSSLATPGTRVYSPNVGGCLAHVPGSKHDYVMKVANWAG